MRQSSYVGLVQTVTIAVSTLATVDAVEVSTVLLGLATFTVLLVFLLVVNFL